MRDQANSMKPVTAIAPAVLAAEPAAITVDRAGFDSVTFIVQLGVGGITFTSANRLDVFLEHSNDGSTWDAVLADQTIGGDINQNLFPNGGRVISLTSAHPATTVHRFGYIDGRVEQKRYVRLRPVFVGTHGTGTPLAATAILGNARTMPVAA